MRSTAIGRDLRVTFEWTGEQPKLYKDAQHRNYHGTPTKGLFVSSFDRLIDVTKRCCELQVRVSGLITLIASAFSRQP
jgi:hypothetical protein